MSNKVKPSVINKALKLYQDGELTTAEICDACGISWGTLHNYIEKNGIKRRATPRRQPKPIEKFKGCPKCSDVQTKPKYDEVDFRNTVKGITIFRVVACSGCRRRYFKTSNMRTGEVKNFLLR